MFDIRTASTLAILLPLLATLPAAAQAPLAPTPPALAPITMPTCPVGNCPTGPRGALLPGGGPVLAGSWLHGQTAKGKEQDEWLSVLGLYIGSGANGGQKVGQYVGAMQGPGGGSGWALNTDIVRGACPGGSNSLFGLPGSGTPFGSQNCTARPGSLSKGDSTIGHELDLTNWDQDAGPGGPLVVGLMVQTLSSYTSSAGILFTAFSQQKVPSWHTGIHFGGPADNAPPTVRENTILDNSGSTYGYHLQGAHAGAGIRDDATGAVAIHLLGTKTGADILVGTASPTAVRIEGTHAQQAIDERSVSPAGLNMSGRYDLAAIVTGNAATPIALSAKAGQSVCFDGVKACARYDAASRKWLFTNGEGRVVSSIDEAGNAIFRGRVVENGEP